MFNSKNMNFENNKIKLENLPDFEEISLDKLSKDYRKVVYFYSIIKISIGLIGSTLVFFLANGFAKWVAILILLVFFVNALYSLKAFTKKRYAFRSYDVIYQYGWWSTTTEILPFNRIQHVVLSQNWIEKRVGLATLEMYSAVADSTSLSIPGLSFEDANRWKSFVLNKIENNESEN